MAQQVRDLALSLLWPQVWPKLYIQLGLFFVFFFFLTLGGPLATLEAHVGVPGQESNPCHSSDNVRSLTN